MSAASDTRLSVCPVQPQIACGFWIKTKRTFRHKKIRKTRIMLVFFFSDFQCRLSRTWWLASLGKEQSKANIGKKHFSRFETSQEKRCVLFEHSTADWAVAVGSFSGFFALPEKLDQGLVSTKQYWPDTLITLITTFSEAKEFALRQQHWVPVSEVPARDCLPKFPVSTSVKDWIETAGTSGGWLENFQVLPAISGVAKGYLIGSLPSGFWHTSFVEF